MKRVRTNLAEVIQLSDNMIKSTVVAPYVTAVEDIKEPIQTVHQHFGKTIYYLSDSRQLKSSSTALRKYLAEHGQMSAAAIIVGSALTAMIANIFISFNRPTYPNKIFNHEADAMAWLVEQGAIAPKN